MTKITNVYLKAAILAFAVLASVSCQKDTLPSGNGDTAGQGENTVTLDISASMDSFRDSIPGVAPQSTDFKMSLITDGGVHVNFGIGDKITVYYKKNDYNPDAHKDPAYVDDGKYGSAVAKCTGIKDNVASFALALPEDAQTDELYAVNKHYNGNAFARNKTSSGTWRYTSRYSIDTVQTAVKGGFDPESVPIVARYPQLDGSKIFRFKNPCGLIKFTLENNCTTEVIEQIHFRTQGGNIHKHVYWWFGNADLTRDTDNIRILQSVWMKDYFYGYNCIVLRGEKNGEGDYAFAQGQGIYYIYAHPNDPTFKSPLISFYTKSGKRATFRYSNTAKDITLTQNNMLDIGTITINDVDFKKQPTFETTISQSEVLTMSTLTHGNWTASITNGARFIYNKKNKGDTYSGSGFLVHEIKFPDVLESPDYIATIKTADADPFLTYTIKTEGKKDGDKVTDDIFNSLIEKKNAAPGATYYDIKRFRFTKYAAISDNKTSSDKRYITGVNVEFLSGEEGDASITFDYFKRRTDGDASGRWSIYVNGEERCKDIGLKSGETWPKPFPIGNVKVGDRISVRVNASSDESGLGTFTWTVTPPSTQ